MSASKRLGASLSMFILPCRAPPCGWTCVAKGLARRIFRAEVYASIRSCCARIARRSWKTSCRTRWRTGWSFISMDRPPVRMVMNGGPSCSSSTVCRHVPRTVSMSPGRVPHLIVIVVAATPSIIFPRDATLGLDVERRTTADIVDSDFASLRKTLVTMT